MATAISSHALIGRCYRISATTTHPIASNHIGALAQITTVWRLVDGACGFSVELYSGTTKAIELSGLLSHELINPQGVPVRATF